MKEQWKDLNGYNDSYEISNTGRIRSKDRFITDKSGRRYFIKGVERRASLGEYRMIVLSKNGKISAFKIARLVALHFIPTEKDRNVVNHIDYNKHNDVVTNLEWVTNAENVLHSQMRSDKTETTGVFYDKKRKKWCSYVYRNNKNIFVGRFNTEKEATLKRQDKLNEFSHYKY